MSGVTEICLTKLDILSGLEEIQVCVNYKLDGKAVRYSDVDAYGLDRVECVYQTVPGWKEDISKARSFEQLPANAKTYVKMIEIAGGVPVKWIGVGPEREATIRKDNSAQKLNQIQKSPHLYCIICFLILNQRQQEPTRLVHTP